MRQFHAVHFRAACAGRASYSLLFLSSTTPKSFVSSSAQRITLLGITSRGVSSVSAAQQEPTAVDWNEAVLSSEVGDGGGGGGTLEEDPRSSIPVRAYVFSTRLYLFSPFITDINRGMEKTGTFTMDSKKLFQIVGKANSNLADVILKLGLFERPDIAWKNAKYAQIWEYLRDGFELTQRFASLDFKLKFVEHNIRFLQEILQNGKSDFLEWCVIVLISAEISLLFLSLLRSPYDIDNKCSSSNPWDSFLVPCLFFIEAIPQG
ncbi:hypothetical protein SLEP1_g5600 [Rubroshorea leprosula]|uniref:DUF155 domain-containing protein n=1 Tax=Rubroshorea leprosula TaxID=152421 RepID=A0AAV5I336_9ROSI|nr:hypothetical protein SLEP1_g5600 [Rubroshorea leprosula]